MGKGASCEKVVREIQRRTRRRFSAEEKIRNSAGVKASEVAGSLRYRKPYNLILLCN